MRLPSALICILSILTACVGKKETPTYPQEIAIDINNCTDIAIDESLIIPLETSDSALLYDICSMEIVNDRLVIFSRDLLKIFDKNTGKFLGNLAIRGEGVGEYLTAIRLWSSGDTLKIFDPNLKVVNAYTSDGTFISRNKTFDTTDRVQPNYFIEMPDGNGIVSINTWMGGIGEPIPTYSYYDNNYNLISNIKGRIMRTGSYLMDRAYADRQNNRILTWEPLIDTLFTVSPNGVTPIYTFSFGENSFPRSKQAIAEMPERINQFMNGEDIPYISLLGYYQTKDKNLYFSAYAADKRNFIIRYNEHNGDNSMYHIVSEDNRYQAERFFKIEGDTAYVAMNKPADPESNPLLYKLPLSELK